MVGSQIDTLAALAIFAGFTFGALAVVVVAKFVQLVIVEWREEGQGNER